MLQDLKDKGCFWKLINVLWFYCIIVENKTKWSWGNFYKKALTCSIKVPFSEPPSAIQSAENLRLTMRHSTECTKRATKALEIERLIYHSRFSQSPSLKKLLQQRFWYFSIPNDRKRSWENFEGMFPELFLRYLHKSEKNGKNNQISYFYLGFWFKIELFEG